jgi:prepilin-type N-terminal cleavage/methylation domain-containing protein
MFDVGRSTFAQRRALAPALSQRERETRAGFTLVEMLVVIFIILAVSVLAIGIAAPNVGPRRLRETARQVDAFLQGAKAMAADTGRPVAVILEPDINQPLMARTLKYAQVPPAYSGDTLTSYAIITAKPPPAAPGAPQFATVRIPNDYPWMSPSDPQHDLVRVGDQLRFNFQGHYYLIVAVNPGNRELTIQAVNTTGVVTQLENMPMPYQVFRQPIPSAGTDLELPEPMVVDLGQSGPEGNDTPGGTPGSGRFPLGTTGQGVAIVFGPGGGVLTCLAGGGVYPVGGPLYLSVGKRELVEIGGNLTDFETYWVAVNSQSGLVSTAENAGVRGVDPNPLNEARDFVRKAISKGAR